MYNLHEVLLTAISHAKTGQAKFLLFYVPFNQTKALLISNLSRRKNPSIMPF